jgi:hypothetical protein
MSNEELIKILRRVCEAFEMEEGMPFAEVISSVHGSVWGPLNEEQSEALMDLAGALEALEDE